MKSACQSFREELHDPHRRSGSTGHPEACPACAEYSARVARAARGVVELGRLAVPAQLDGLVVAALQTGVREERAARAVSHLAREALPDSLDTAVETKAAIAAELGVPLDRARVPSVLDRLVDEELADPTRATVRRHVSSLPRERAPSELDARVHADLLDARDPFRKRYYGRRQAIAGASIAAGLLALLFLRILTVRDGGRPPPSFRVEAATLEDLQFLDPFAREAVASLGGGLLSAREL